jgi:hypothetical protein
MTFIATRVEVYNRGVPPTEFLTELVDWAHGAPADIFAVNDEAGDVYDQLKPLLGPWTSMLHRRAAMLELMRVHAGFESSWNWNEGVDTTNKTSLININGQETGIFQVSFNSSWLGNDAMKPFLIAHGVNDVAVFIPRMKSDHPVALEYYARLVRFNTRWAGPILRHEIDPWLSRDAVSEFEGLLA